MPALTRSMMISVDSASMAFSMSSLMMLAGRSAISPAAIWLIKVVGNFLIFGIGYDYK